MTSVKSTPKGRISSIFTGGKHLLVWEGGSDQFLAGARVSTAGTVSTNWSDGFRLVPGLDYIDFTR